MKYRSSESASGENLIKGDIAKIKEYVKKMEDNCQYYFSVIYETECNEIFWMDGRSSTTWAKDRVTELVAGRHKDITYFKVYSYNEMNKSLNTPVGCEFWKTNDK